MRTYPCIVVDDDELDRLTTVSFVERFPFLDLKVACASALEALAETRRQKPDVLFLDIDMPGMDGLELRKALLQVPACIFVTSFPEYALEGYENAALDFLLKPLKAHRFAMAMGRLQQYLEARRKSDLYDYSIGTDTILIKEGRDHVRIKLQDVIYLEALKDYTGIVTTEKKFCVLTPLGSLLRENGFTSFVRIHRSYAVQKHFVRKVAAAEVLAYNVALPVGRMYKDALKRLLE